MNKKRKKVLAVFLIIVVFFGVLTFIFKAKYENINNSYVSETGVYTPGGIPQEYHIDLSIDTFEYWVYKLNKSEQKEIEEDLKSGYWLSGDYNNIRKFGFEQETDGVNECYICCYDVYNECFVSVIDIENYPSPCVIYFYDAVTHYYYCIHWSM